MSEHIPSWIDPSGAEYPLKKGETHADFARNELYKIEFADASRKRPEINKPGSSGEVAQTAANSSVGEANESHCRDLENLGWTMASPLDGDMIILRSSSLDNFRSSWSGISKIGSKFGSAIFVVGDELSVGMPGRELARSADAVINRINMACGSRTSGPRWSPCQKGIDYCK